MDCPKRGRNRRIRHFTAGIEDTSPKVGKGLEEALCGGSSAVRFLVLDELGDAHQIVGQHCGAHQHLEPLTAFGPAPLHSATAKQHGDAALYPLTRTNVKPAPQAGHFTARQAANHAKARYLMLYLQNEQKLRNVYRAFQSREIGSDPASLLSSTLQTDLH